MAQIQQSGEWVCPSGHRQNAAPQPQNVVDSHADSLMVVVSAIMGLLAVLLLVRGLLGRLSGAATTHSTVHLFLWVVFAIFLPLTSYMFSQTEKLGAHPLRQVLILMWMLLAELLRKKLDGVRTINASPLQGVNKLSARDTVDQIVPIAWIGYLMYSHKYDGIILVTLWVLGIMKIAQRVVAVEVAKHSFAMGENSHLVAGYMRQLFAAEGEETAATETGGGEDQNVVMTECKYVIMGEDNVERKVGPQGYSLVLTDDKEKKKMVTVGDVWRLAESDKAHFTPFAPCAPPSAAEAQGCLSCFALYKRLRSRVKKCCYKNMYPLKNLCLSFALYKLLRRRFEDYPSAEAGRPESLQFLLSGLLGDDKVKVDKDDKDKGEGDKDKVKVDKDDKVKVDKDNKDKGEGDKDKGERVFRVIGDELNFLRDYYFSTIPLFLSNLWFFLLNYVLMLVIPFFCFIVILIFSNLYIVACVFRSSHINQFNHSERVNIVYDLIVTLLLIATLLLLEFAEALVYVLSDWVVVSLLCTYAKNPSWRKYAIVRWVLTTLGMVKTSFKHPKLKLSQHSIFKPHYRTQRIFSKLVLPPMLLKLVPCRCFHGLWSTPIPKEVKLAIVNYLVENGGRGPEPPIGKSVLRRNGTLGQRLLWACKSNGVAETIIVWHIATCHYEEHPLPQRQESNDRVTQEKRNIAKTLSKYCAYLVALAPELLPDDTAGTKAAYKAAVKEIEKEDGERVTRNRNPNGTAAERGMELGHQLVDMAGRNDQQVWKVLADLWTEIMVYAAPSDDVKSHAQALAHGGEFITHIWALLSHGGILRWTDAPPPPADHDQSPV